MSLKGKALRRAVKVNGLDRLNEKIPLIYDETLLITPEIAEEMLKKNCKNRPINWAKVEEYAKIMESGGWKLHSQGIILDADNNILTGQKRLWAVVYSNQACYFRVSRGCPKETAHLIDRGAPQTARDLSSRKTDRKHSPTEASICRAVCVLRGMTSPGVGDIAALLVEKNDLLKQINIETKGTKKTKGMLMILGAIIEIFSDKNVVCEMVRDLERLDSILQSKIAAPVNKCWGKGVAFSMAMKAAAEVCIKEGKKGH